MEWTHVMLAIFGTLVILMAIGMPVAFCFLLINVVGSFLIFRGTTGLENMILSMYSSVVTFILLPIPLFVLMGEVMFQSGLALRTIRVIDQWLGAVPGRLSLLSIVCGTIFAALTGSSAASTALLGSALVPEMENRGYKTPISVGSILGSGGLASMIPPSGLAVFVAAIGEISVGKMLIAIIIPGILMATFYSLYICIRCGLQPSLAPKYKVTAVPLTERLRMLIVHVFPLGIVIFMLIGFILLGIATPSEAAATGCMGTFIVVLIFKRLNWEVLKKSILSTVKITGMIFLIIAGAKDFGGILSFTGATTGMMEFVIDQNISPIVFVIIVQIIVLFMGSFMSMAAITMIILPMVIPLIINMGFDPVWFGTIFMVNLEVAMISPPFGINLYVMKGVAPSHMTMGEIMSASFPFIGLNIIVMALIIFIPPLALWLPGALR